MTDDVKRFEFLIKQKPICTQTPIKEYIGAERHRELRSKYKLELGIDLLADRCDNIYNCNLKGSGCAGRPFPKDPELLEAYQKINVEIEEVDYKDRPVYLAKAIVDCNTCPFKVGCESSCPTQDSYLNKRRNPDLSPSGSMLVPYEDYEKGKYGPAFELNIDDDSVDHSSWEDESLPLDCLSPKQRQVLEMTLYQG